MADDNRTELNTTQARGAARSGVAIYVLVASTALIIAAFAFLFLR